MTAARVAAALLLLAVIGGFALIAAGWLGGAGPPAAVLLAEVQVPMPPQPQPPASVLPPPLESPPPAPPPSDRSAAQPLVPAPDPALVEKGPHGPLPAIGRDGRQPWRVYARPFDRADRRPRVAVIITGLGLSSAETETGIGALPGAVTLAFNPYAPRLDEWIERARAAGHEVLLSLPMEPADYPRQDPGPYTLLTSLSSRENLDRLDWVLSRVTGYVGLTNMMGARFTTSQNDLIPVFEELKKRGLLFVDGRASEQSIAGPLAASMGLPRVIADDTLDGETTREAIDRHLLGLEADAERNGAALGIGFAYPVTLERVALWAKALDGKGIALAPASALAGAEQKGAAQ